MTADPRRTEHYRELDAAHHLHPLFRHGGTEPAGQPGDGQGEGIHVWDSDGVRLIDDAGRAVVRQPGLWPA